MKIGDYVRGTVVRTKRVAEGTVLGVHERTVSIDNGKGDRVMLDKENIENIGIGAKIKERRTELGLSQATVAAKVGVNQSLLSYWEKGKSEPPAERIALLEKELGITLAGFNGVTVSYDASLISKPLRERDILDKEGNFKNKVPAFKEPEKKEPEIEQVVTDYIDFYPGPITREEMDKIFPDEEPFITISPLDLEDIIKNFFPRFNNFHADYQLAGAVELLLQAEAGNACLDDLRKARAKLDKAIACLEK